MQKEGEEHNINTPQPQPLNGTVPIDNEQHPKINSENENSIIPQFHQHLQNHLAVGDLTIIAKAELRTLRKRENFEKELESHLNTTKLKLITHEEYYRLTKKDGWFKSWIKSPVFLNTISLAVISGIWIVAKGGINQMVNQKIDNRLYAKEKRADDYNSINKNNPTPPKPPLHLNNQRVRSL